MANLLLHFFRPSFAGILHVSLVGKLFLITLGPTSSRVPRLINLSFNLLHKNVGLTNGLYKHRKGRNLATDKKLFKSS